MSVKVTLSSEKTLSSTAQYALRTIADQNRIMRWQREMKRNIKTLLEKQYDHNN